MSSQVLSFRGVLVNGRSLWNSKWVGQRVACFKPAANSPTYNSNGKFTIAIIHRLLFRA